MEADLTLRSVPTGVLVKSNTFNGQEFCRAITGELADPIVDPTGVVLIERMAKARELTIEDERDV